MLGNDWRTYLKPMAKYPASDTLMGLTKGNEIVVFDGACVLCSGFMKFMLRRDTEKRFKFVIAQSDLGEQIYSELGLKSDDYNTNIVVKSGQVFTKLDAFAASVGSFGGVWRLAKSTSWIPSPLANWIYDRFAKNRYQVFGRTEACLVPSPDLKAQFLG